MNNELRRQAFLGLFILVGVALFIFGIFQIGSRQGMFAKSFTIRAIFTNSGGLKAGAQVRYEGFKVGIVKSITFANDSALLVEMSIDKDKQGLIRKDATAVINSNGLMGDKLINISRGEGKGAPVQPNDFINSREPADLDKAMSSLGQSSDTVKAILSNVKSFTYELKTGRGPLQSLYRDSLMATNLKQSFSNLKGASQSLRMASATLQDIAHRLQDGKGTLGLLLHDSAMGRSLKNTVTRLDSASISLHKATGQITQTIDKINSGKSALGIVLHDTTIATELRQSVRNIKDASEGARLNMEALKHTFLLRGGYRRMEAEQQNEQPKKKK